MSSANTLASAVTSRSNDLDILPTAPAHGLVSIDPDGSFTYTPALDYNGPDVFTFTFSDGGLSDLGRVEITVEPVNDVPVVDAGADQNSSEGQPTQFSGSYTDPGFHGIQAVTITWDFGDGTTITRTLIPMHTYANDAIVHRHADGVRWRRRRGFGHFAGDHRERRT